MSSTSIDWELGEVTIDESTMFILWCIQSGLCNSILDFQRHFKNYHTITPILSHLINREFVSESSASTYSLTSRGLLALGDLADMAASSSVIKPHDNTIGNGDIKIGSMVISTNPLHSVLGIGFVERLRGEQAKIEFRPTVFSPPPYISESRIVGIEDLQIIATPIQRIIDSDFDEPWQFDLRTLAAHLIVSNKDGQLGDARTDLLPHQISVANKVVTSPRKRYLIADEVGLGKTIETGMILYALRQRREAQRVLIITPAGLTLQWQEEMLDKFGLQFAVYREDVDGPLAFDKIDYLIASINTLKRDIPSKSGNRDSHKTLVLGARDWDVIIFDEAHKLSAKSWSPQKIDKTQNYKLAEDLRNRSRTLLLLTATPHQGDESKFQNLMSLLDENVVFDEFVSADTGTAVPFTELILRNRKSKVTDADGNPIFKGIEIHPVRKELLVSGEKKFHKALEAYLREGYGYANQDPRDIQRKAIGFVMTTFQKLAASSTNAIKQALLRRLNNLVKIANASNAEKLEYDARFQGEYDTKLAESVTDVFVDTEVQMLNNLIDLDVPEDSKQGELLNVIDSMSKEYPSQLVLIFTEYIATQDMLVGLLKSRYGDGCTAIIRGGMTLWGKKQSMSAFRDSPSVRFLVSTEAGGEGINLQFAHIMINYDLPWNPFRLAQRYGRLYRYGQDNVVQVFNFQNTGTIEDRIREYLENKTKTAAVRLSGITGETVEEVEEGLLGLFEEFVDYERIYREGLAKGNIRPSQEEIDQGVERAERAYKTAYTSLFSKDLAPFNPDRFKHEIQSPLSLTDVEYFVSEFVKHNGRNFTKSKDGSWEFITPQILRDIPGLKSRYGKVTFDREQAIKHPEIEFMALGHPFTDAVIHYCGSVEFGGMASNRSISNSRLTGVKGLHANFIVKRTRSTSEGEVVYLDLVPVFVKPDNSVDETASEMALFQKSEPGINDAHLEQDDIQRLYDTASSYVLSKYKDNEIWEEDVFCLNAAVSEFGS